MRVGESTRWCFNESAIFLSSKVIREKRYISKLLSFLLWPELEGSRYDLKRSTRVLLDSKRPMDSFSLYPTALSQLGAKGRGLAPPAMCVLWWGNSMCGRGLKKVSHSAPIFFFIFFTTLLGILNVKDVKAGIIVGRSGQFCQESESFKICQSLGVDKTLAINEL